MPLDEVYLGRSPEGFEMQATCLSGVGAFKMISATAPCGVSARADIEKFETPEAAAEAARMMLTMQTRTLKL
jgi:hypothetical protein